MKIIRYAPLAFFFSFLCVETLAVDAGLLETKLDQFSGILKSSSAQMTKQAITQLVDECESVESSEKGFPLTAEEMKEAISRLQGLEDKTKLYKQKAKAFIQIVEPLSEEFYKKILEFEGTNNQQTFSYTKKLYCLYSIVERAEEELQYN